MMQLNESNFTEETSQGVVVVDFYADWCGPCRMLSPVLEQVKGAKVVKVNVEESPNLGVQFNVSAIPKMVFLKDGVQQGELLGLQNLPAIQKKVDALNV